MPSIVCPQCATKLTAPPEVLGQPVRCTKCGGTFTASPTHSAYLEGLTPLPRDRRPYILGSAILASLLLVTGLVLGLNQTPNDLETEELGGVVAPLPLEKPREPLPMVTADGTPIELPDEPGLPPPGAELSPAMKKMMGSGRPVVAEKKPGATLDDVTLISLRWDVRKLVLNYTFHNGGAIGDAYSLKVRFNEGAVQDMPLSVNLPASGSVSLDPRLDLADPLPKVEAWVEHTQVGISRKVSNVVRAE